MSQGELLRTRRFAPFFWTQFLGALNDNLFKNALVILFAFGAAESALSTDVLVNLAAGVFIFPFFVFSATSGQLADKLEKSRIIRAVKLLEIGIMCVGAIGFQLRSVPVLLVALFAMGVHSTLFGPVKYSILPQHLREDELVGGNALVEMGTFVAILVGTILGGVLVAIAGWGPIVVSVATIGTAVAGWLVSRGVPAASADDPSLRIRWNPVTETWRMVGFAREVHSVFLSILGISWFWFYGALFLAQFPGLGRDLLGGDEHVVTLLLTVFSIGIGLGCMLCERLSSGVIELGLVPFGSIGLTLFALDLAWATHLAAARTTPLDVAGFLASPRHWRVAADLLLIGVFGGFFIVPLLAFVQHRSEPRHRSRIIAANNIVSAFFMVVAAGVGIVLRTNGFTIPQLFLFTAIVNALVAIYIFTVIPEFLMRFIIWLLVHTVYRVEQRGLEHLPQSGPAVVVANHVSFVDALVIAAASRRPMRFVMDHAIFRLPILHFVFRTGRAIPIAPRKEDPARLERAYDEVAHALEEGDLVCIFPEGKLTTTGDMNPFRPGIERIVARTPVPVIPMALRGLWGSFFSRFGGAAMRRPFRRVWSRIEVVCGAPVAPELATAPALEAQVLALRGDWR
ncbi:MAG TPA: MFS transporter [Candidatus Eisenbacteria bacterium]|nr:MFS transporter [Candidatus Eisenbacteria bacterium]